MASQVDTFVSGLTSSDAVERGNALKHLPIEMLADQGVLAAVLRLTRDGDAVPAQFQPKPEVDPFADFFGIQKEVEPLLWSGMAMEKLSNGGPEGTEETLDTIRGVMDEGPLTDDLCTAVCRLVGDVAWRDEAEAVRRLLSPQIEAGRSLFQALPRLGLPGLDAVLGLALEPFSTRTLNELFNHPRASDGAARALCRRIVKGELEPTESEALELLPLLAVWGKNDANAAGGAMAVLEQSYPWASAFAGFANPKAAERFGAWCERGEQGPDGFSAMLVRALRDRPDLATLWPLESFLRWGDLDGTIIEEWRLVPGHPELLTEWVQLLATDNVRPARGWDAAGLMAEAGIHGELVDTIAGMLPGMPADPILVERLAKAKPPIPGVGERIAELILDTPSLLPALLPSLKAAGVPAGFAESYIAVCEAAPEETITDAADRAWIARAGCVPESLEGMVADEALSARLQAVLPRRA